MALGRLNVEAPGASLPRALETTILDNTMVSDNESSAVKFGNKGWQLVPCNYESRTPFPGYTGGKKTEVPFLSTNEVLARLGDIKNYTVAIRPPLNVIGFDVDDYEDKSGAVTLAKAEALHGELPATYSLTARGSETPSRRLWFRIPADLVVTDKFFTQYGGHIETIRTGHRFSWAPPHIHHRNGEPVRWYDPARKVCDTPHVNELPELPAEWVTAIREFNALHPERTAGTPGEPELMARGQMDAAVTTSANRVIDCCGSWSGDFRSALWGWAANYARRATALGEDPRDTIWDAVTDLFAEGGEVPDDDDEQHVENGLLEAVETPWALATAEPLPALSSASVTTGFWDETPILRHIHDAAISRRVNPLAMLSTVLGEFASMQHHETTFDVGQGPSILSIFVALVANSGGGKTKTTTAANALMKDYRMQYGPQNYFIGALGSGEGLVEAYMGSVEAEVQRYHEDGTPMTNPDTGEAMTKVKQLRKQTRHNALITVDEGAKLTELLNRPGATIASTLTSWWIGANVGETNADPTKNRFLAASSYVGAMVFGIQADKIAPLFTQGDLGLPQRFLFAPTEYAPLADLKRRDLPEFPGPLKIVPAWHGMGCQATTVTFPEWVMDEVDEEQAARSAGKDVRVGSHDTLMQCRLAALLALLHGENHVSDQYWTLAGRVMTASIGLRDALGKKIASEASEAANDRAERETKQRVDAHRRMKEVDIDLDVINKAINRLVKALDDGPKSRSDLKRQSRLTSEKFDEVMAEAVRRGEVETYEGDRPARGPAVTMVRTYSE